MTTMPAAEQAMPDGVEDRLETGEEPAVVDPDPEAEVVEEEPDPVADFELPEDPAEAISLLLGEVVVAQAATAGAVDRWKRTAAEFDNYRKRSQRDQAAMIARASERVVGSLLPVLDSLDSALTMEAGTSEQGLRQGLVGTRDLLLSTLAKEGLEPIDALGKVFDPNLHEAAHIGEGSGTMVVEAEWRRGYTLNGRVIRATLVAVGYLSAAVEEPSGEDQAGEDPETP